jgi:putative transport protein
MSGFESGLFTCIPFHRFIKLGKMDFIADTLRHHVELALFLTLALGFFFGRLKIGSFKLGPMLGCLFAGVIVGQIGIPVPSVVKLIFFDLFLFATGYKVGPQFFYGFRKGALPQLVLTVVICTSCLLVSYLTAKIMGYDVGTAAGLLAGAFSESTVIGTASDAIEKLNYPAAEQTRLINEIPVTYAITYLIGTLANVWFLSTGAPKLLRIDLKEEARKLSRMFSGGTDKSDLNSAYREWVLRAYTVSSGKWAGRSVAEIETSVPEARIIVERIRQNGFIQEPSPATVIHEGDTIVVAARQNVMLEKMPVIGQEVFDKQLMDFPLVNSMVVVANKDVSGKSLKDLAQSNGQGIILNKLIRSGNELPFEPQTIINNGDVLAITGRQVDVDRVSNSIGYVKETSFETDMIFVGIGIVLGGLLGLLSTNIGGIAITLSTSGGALVMGLVFGWLHSKTPKYGNIPEGALWVFDNLGLATFLAIVGLAAGKSFISDLQEMGPGILLSGLIVALLPHVIGLFFGRYILKMNPLILLGAQTGAGTTTTALKALQDAAESKVPALGYTVPYALGNILLTAWGPVIVSLMTLHH